MFQLTYTSCRPGLSITGLNGYAVRAASPNTDQRWLDLAPQLARYDVSSISSGTSGVRLSFHRRQGASVITHSSRVLDHDSRLATFMHAVIDATGKLGPADAVGSWGSPFWQRADSPGPTKLPVIAGLPSDGRLTPAVVQCYLQDDRFRAMADFLLGAWLRNVRPIVLFADADKVAATVWFVVRCLPLAFLGDLSFATRDHEPLTAGVAVAGCEYAVERIYRSESNDQCWFHIRSGKSSGGVSIPCTEFMCNQARLGNWHVVDAFSALCRDLHIDRLEDLNLLHSVLHKNYVCTPAEMIQDQRQPHLLRWLLQEKRHAQVAIAILTDVVAGDQPARQTLAAIVVENPGLQQLLVSAVAVLAAKALLAGDLSRAKRLVALCDRTMAPSILWQRAVNEAGGVACLTIQVRMSLAETLAQQAANHEESVLAFELIDIPSEELPAVLQCPVRSSLKVEAYRASMRRIDALPSAAIQALASDPAVLGQLLRITDDPTATASTIAIQAPHAVLEILIADQIVQRRVDIDAVLHRIFATGTPIEKLATPGFARYWELLLRSCYAGRIAAEILNLPVAQYVKDEILEGLRRSVGSASISPLISAALARRVSLIDALCKPAIPLLNATDVLLATAELPVAEERREITHKLLHRLAMSIAAELPPNAVRDLQALMALAASTGSSKPDLLREFAKAALASGQLLKESTIATATIAYAFGAIGPVLDAERDKLVDLGVELLHLYARAGGPMLNHQVAAAALQWREPARTLFRVTRQRLRINGHLLAKLARSRVALTEH